MTNPTIVGHYANNTGSSSATSVSVTLTSVAAGDLVLCVVAGERATAALGTPVTGASNAFTSDANSADTTMAWSFSHYTLVSADITAGSCTITSTVAGGNSRRQGISATVFRSWSGQAFQGGTYTANGNGVYTATAPSITPSDDDATVSAALAYVSNVTPYQRTYSVDSPYTLGAGSGSTSTTSTNAYAVTAYEDLTGQSGVPTAGATFNDTTPEKFAWIAGTWSVTAPQLIEVVVDDSMGVADGGTSTDATIGIDDSVGVADPQVSTDATIIVNDAIGLSDAGISTFTAIVIDDSVGMTEGLESILPSLDQTFNDTEGVTDRIAFGRFLGRVDDAGIGDRLVVALVPPDGLTFRGPTELRTLLAWPRHPLFSRIKTPVGLTVLKNGASYTTVENPTDEQLEAADVVYLGGHVYSVTADEANSLTAAGYGSCLSME